MVANPAIMHTVGFDFAAKIRLILASRHRQFDR
jgi:hypothetical protein